MRKTGWCRDSEYVNVTYAVGVRVASREDKTRARISTTPPAEREDKKPITSTCLPCIASGTTHRTPLPSRPKEPKPNQGESKTTKIRMPQPPLL